MISGRISGSIFCASATEIFDYHFSLETNFFEITEWGNYLEILIFYVLILKVFKRACFLTFSRFSFHPARNFSCNKQKSHSFICLLDYLKRFWTGLVLVLGLKFESFFFDLLAWVDLGNKNVCKGQH